MSEEERIRRAELLSEKRKNNISSKNFNQKEKNKMTFLSRFSIQVLISICIFGICYFLTENYSFAIEKIKPVISNDTNFEVLYWNINDAIKNFSNQEIEEQPHTNELTNNSEKSGEEIKQETKQDTNTTEISETTNGIGGGDEQIEESKTEDDVSFIKNHASFIKPVSGTITSGYGPRTPTEIISANHAGIDIGANTGTIILASMEGKVEEVSAEGGYGNHVKISNGEISTIYAHCNKILVKQGDYIYQGQEIAEVGATGNATGPHLHFEIRRNNITVNPQEILDL